MLKNPDATPKTPASPQRLTRLFGVAAVLILLLGIGVIFMLNAQIQSKIKMAHDKEAQVGSSEQVARRYQETQDTYDKTFNRIHFLESSVSQKSYVPTLLQQLQGLAEANHLTVTAVRPAPSAPVAPPPPNGTAATAKKAAPPYDTLDIAVDVTGTYADTATLLYSLTKFPKIISVASAQFHPAPLPGADPNAAPNIATTLHLTAFVFRDDEIPAGGPAAQTTAGTQTASGIPTTGTPTTTGIQTTGGSGATGSAATGIAHGALGPAAARAVGGAIGADRASRERSQIGVSTL